VSWRRLALKPEYAALATLVALVLVNSLFTPNFATAGNLWNVLLQVSTVVLAAVGMTFAGWFLLDTLRVVWGPMDHRIAFYEVAAVIGSPVRLFTGLEGNHPPVTVLFMLLCGATLFAPLSPYLSRHRFAWLAGTAPLALMVGCAVLLYVRTSGDVFATRGIGDTIGFRDGMGFVGGEVVPEVFIVDAFPSLNQGFRCGAVETEMPDAGIVVDVFPAGDAGEKGVHDNELFDFGWELGGVGIGDHQANVVTDDAGFFDAERFGESVNAGGGRFHVETVGGDTRVADSGEVRCDHGEFFGKPGNERAPHAGCLRVAVEQDDGGTMARGEIVKLEAVDGSRFGGDRGRSGAASGKGEKAKEDRGEDGKFFDEQIHENPLSCGSCGKRITRIENLSERICEEE